MLYVVLLSTIIGQMKPTKEPLAFYQYSLDLIDNEILGAAGIWVGITKLSDASETMREQSESGSTFTLDQSYGENGDIYSVAIEKDETSLLLTILVIDEIVNKLFIRTYFEFDGSVESRKQTADMFELALQNRVNNLGQPDNPIPGLYAWSNSKSDYHLLRVESESGGYFISEVIFLNSQKTITDFDSKKHQTVQIGNQVWMAENLKVTRYRDGTPIPNVTDDTKWGGLSTGAYGVHSNDESNADTYGYLYNWYAVNGDTDGDGVKDKEIAPEGWHVPTDDDWRELENYLSSNGHSGTEGAALKSTTGWNSSGNGTDDYGFIALPSGYRIYDGIYGGMSYNNFFWSATGSSSSHAWNRRLYWGKSDIRRNADNKKNGFSIRCLRD
jgi:uncharacterized protein (TIGR02145 family)